MCKSVPQVELPWYLPKYLRVMSGKALIDQIKHYQKDIERCPENSERMIRCIKRLYVLPVLVQHLQETGVGRSVNALRKYNGEVGEAAKALVAKWKAMVAAEESSEEGEQVKEVTPEKVIQEQQKHSKTNKSEKTHSSRPEDEHKKRVHPSSKSDRKSSEKHSSSKHKYSKQDKEKNCDESDSSNDSSSRRKRKKHSSPEKKITHSKTKRQKVVESSESEEEASGEDECSRNGDFERETSDKSDEEEIEEEEELEEEEEDEKSESEEEIVKEEESEEESDSSSDHRHRSKHKHSHHKSSHSSHSSRSKSSHSSRDKHHSEKKREEKNKSKHSHSHSKSKSSSEDLSLLIKENEKKVKKEKEEKPEKKKEKEKCNKKEKQIKVKIEKNEDGSIDAGSGASFAEALMVGDSIPSPKKKKKQSSSNHSKRSESSHSHHASSSKSHRSKESSSSSSSKSKESSKHSGKEKDLTKMPDMLKKPIKVESISLDISSTLPEILPHYKPLPQAPQQIGLRRLSKTCEEEAMSSIMTTKYQRTKVYSGNKAGGYNYVPSLYILCIQLLYDNIDAVEFTGGVPYYILKPLLQKLNADQLFVLEHHNPYLVEDTDSMWEFHCRKDFRNASRQELESWRELYMRCMEEREKKLKALTENITKSMASSTPVRQAKLAYVDSVAKPPRNVARKQAKYGTGTSSPVKQEIIKKAVVGGHTPGVTAKDVVPPPHQSSRGGTQIIKKKKAPLMAKALQLIKGNRFKR